MNTSILPPAVEHCLVHHGITIRDFEYGWITVCENQEQGLGYVYFMNSEDDYPKTDAIVDLILPTIVLRERIASAISQGSAIHLG